jgi:hypothetical protein
MRVHVKLFEARRLPWVKQRGGTSLVEPNAVITVRNVASGEESTTQHLKFIGGHATESPVFGDEFHFDIVAYNSDVLEFLVGDRQCSGRYRHIYVNVWELPLGRVYDHWYELVRHSDAPPNDGVSGSDLQRLTRSGDLRLQFNITPADASPWQEVSIPFCQVTFTAIEAKDLPKMDTFGTCDPYCLASLEKSRLTWRSKVIKKTYTPTWNDTISFILTNPQTDRLKVSLYDWDLMIDEEIGSVLLDLPPVGAPPVEAWVEVPAVVKAAKRTPSIRYRVQVEPVKNYPVAGGEAAGRSFSSAPPQIRA